MPRSLKPITVQCRNNESSALFSQSGQLTLATMRSEEKWDTKSVIAGMWGYIWTRMDAEEGECAAKHTVLLLPLKWLILSVWFIKNNVSNLVLFCFFQKRKSQVFEVLKNQGSWECTVSRIFRGSVVQWKNWRKGLRRSELAE